MKRWMALLFAALMLTALMPLPGASALTGPRYPANQGRVTDAAAVLSADTVKDLRTLAERFRDEDTLRLYVVTVDFLDGATLSAYGEALRERWEMDEDDLLLLMAVGEDRFGFFGGAYVNEHISAATLQKLLSTHFEAPFLRQDYDGALAALMPALATEVGKAWHGEISVRGLFGQTGASGLVTELDWLDRAVEQAERHSDRASREAMETGLSFGKVVLTVLLLLVIFGNRGRRRDRNGCGCGCMPFSSLLAGWGIWRLWRK